MEEETSPPPPKGKGRKRKLHTVDKFIAAATDETDRMIAAATKEGINLPQYLETFVGNLMPRFCDDVGISQQQFDQWAIACKGMAYVDCVNAFEDLLTRTTRKDICFIKWKHEGKMGTIWRIQKNGRMSSIAIKIEPTVPGGTPLGFIWNGNNAGDCVSGTICSTPEASATFISWLSDAEELFKWVVKDDKNHLLNTTEGVVKAFEAFFVAYNALQKTGVLHMDLKPENIMIYTWRDKNGVLQIRMFYIDWGLAVVVPEDPTKVAVLSGSSSYVHPHYREHWIHTSDGNRIFGPNYWGGMVITYILKFREFPLRWPLPDDKVDNLFGDQCSDLPRYYTELFYAAQGASNLLVEGNMAEAKQLFDKAFREVLQEASKTNTDVFCLHLPR